MIGASLPMMERLPSTIYAKAVDVGQVMEGRAVCEVVNSNVPNYQAGGIVVAATGWPEFSLSEGNGAQKVDHSLGPISHALGVFGMPGLTAYTGLLNIGQPQPGETLVAAAKILASGNTAKESIACKRLHAALDVDFLHEVVQQSDKS
jgi:hypothetical protein